MTKEEFLDGLMKALASTGSQSLIAENIRFYSSYIDDELSKGRSIDEIMEELGEPRLIANSIKVAAGYDDVFVGIDNETYENTASKTGNYEENENYSDRKDKSFKTYNYCDSGLSSDCSCGCCGIFIFGTGIVTCDRSTDFGGFDKGDFRKREL